MAPLAQQYADCAVMLNYNFTIEVVLQDLYSYFYYVSLFELGSYFFNALFMIARPQASSLWYMILGLIHPIRALIGLYIVRLFPLS